MSQAELSKKQIKFLKASAHALKPVVRVGQHGLSEGVLNELEIALDHHELIKVKIAAEDRTAIDTMAEQLSNKTNAIIVQRIGGILVLFRRNTTKPVIDLKAAMQ